MPSYREARTQKNATEPPAIPTCAALNPPPTTFNGLPTKYIQEMFQPCAGDIEASFQNIRGISRMDVCTEYMARVMATSHIHGMAETNHDSITAVIMKHKVERSGQYILLSNPTQHGGNVGKGTALLVARSILDVPEGCTPPPADNEIIYNDKNGKMMAVHLYLRKKPTVIVIMHLPHTDADRAEYLNTAA